jgi:hypothetical protein
VQRALLETLAAGRAMLKATFGARLRLSDSHR